MLVQVAPPHPRLGSALMHFMAVSVDDCEYHVPAGLSPALAVFVRGSADLLAQGQAPRTTPRFSLSGPFLGPRRAKSTPGTLALVVLFRPGYVEPCLGVPAAALVNRDVDMRDIADTGRIDAMFDALDGASSISGYLHIFQEYLLSTLDLDQKKSMAESFFEAHQKMFFPLIDLALLFGIGRRQLERRVKDVFGVSLRDVRSLSRWGLCMERLVNTRFEWGDLAHLAQDSGYFDQAHMTREFIDLAGIAPLPLLKKIASDDPAYWAYRIRGEDFKNLFLPVR